MSDSGDDWFEKDIDEIVQEVQKKKEPLPCSSFIGEEKEDDSNQKGKQLQKFAFEGDYGGNYELPKPRDKKPKPNKQQKTEKFGSAHTVSFKKLTFISELSPLNVFLEVTQNDCGFFSSFDDENLSNEFLILIIKVLSKLINLPFDEFKKEFLSVFISSHSLLIQIQELLTNIFIETVVKNKKTIFHININEIATEIILILKNLQKYNLINDAVKEFIKKFLDVVNKAGNKFLSPKIELNNLYQNIIDSENKMNQKSKDIYPALDELMGNNIEELKPNIIKGKYDSVKHYLDIHKSLLREDFISPLRDTITELRSAKSLDDISMKQFYRKVKFILSDSINAKNRKGEVLLVDLKPDQRIMFNSTAPIIPENITTNPKALMFGSLLCFTTSLEFNDLILAVISNRDSEMLSKGYINVEIVKIYNISTIFENEFIMLESEVYFEPYNQVYQVMRGLDESNFPMANFIVSADNEHQLPDYLVSSKKNPIYEYNQYEFDPLDYENYPQARKLKINESQLEAFQHALSHKFSLIQGPPGTGKTYIGLKIASTLINNVDSQILIICFTNHALDQFLSGILKVTTDIVRMGNQSKHEHLDKYNIKQMTDSIITDRRLKSCFYNTRNEYMKKLQEFEILQKSYDKTEDSYKKIQKVQEELRRISRKLEELKQISEYNLINDKKVIGMTTTCAARCNLLLRLLKTPIVIIEEAAEILETHIIASITKETQHVILIGDHQQLRPKTSVYKMSQKYKMDISLFERMINNNINCVCLSIQHRMREEIADLLRPTIYKNLQDHECVKKYKNIKGVEKNLYFITHNNVESKQVDETTKKNIFEAQFLVAFANYLVMQGHNPYDIILLTTYNGQMIQILNEKKHYTNLLKVKVTVIDNFQGEERKIVLLSLVRNNSEDRIGHLNLKNRICVILSRAKEGLYIIGNMDLMARNSEIWNEIKTKLNARNAVGESLPLKCDRHGMIMEMKTPSDFDLVKFGGCRQCCGFVLPCGHSCGYMCHWDGFEHSANCECH